MRRRHIHLLGLSGLAATATGVMPDAVYAESLILVPIVGQASSLKGISLGLLTKIYLGHLKEDQTGQRFIPFNQPPRSKARVLFDRKVLGMSPDEVSRYWINERIRGQRKPPRSTPNASLLKRVVNRLPGSIAYVEVKDLDTTVKPLLVDGKSHTQPGYVLKG